jgi:hypothetical protein
MSIALHRIEVWRDGQFLHSHVVPNANVAKVYAAQVEARGFRALLVRTRTETERAS